MLDTTVKDKEQQVSILMARVKSLEEQVNKDIYERYFPQNQPDPYQTKQKPTIIPPGCPIPPQCGPSQCQQPYQPLMSCSCHNFHHHPCTQTCSQCPPHTQSSSFLDISKQVLKIEKIISEVKSKVVAIEAINREQQDNMKVVSDSIAAPSPLTVISNEPTHHDDASTDSPK